MLTSVELFAGAGGLGLGLSLAGFRPVAVLEWNQWACDTIRRNSDWPLFQGDVRHFDWGSIAGPIDLVAGGPPCQPFSMGGRHRAHGDARDMFPAMAEAVRRLRPRAFIVENVKGLTRPAFAQYFDYILARLRRPAIVRATDEDWTHHFRRLRQPRQGGPRYDVAVGVLNAADHGVPQKRERVFIVGFRNDLVADWSFPTATHGRDALLIDQWVTGAYWERHGIASGACPAAWRDRVRALREGHAAAPGLAWRTVRDALAGLPDPETDPAAARRLSGHRFQPGVRFYPGHTGSALDQPAKTLKAGDHGVPGGENALVRPDGSGRYFTVREAARLQTFPDSHGFEGGWSEVMRQLGNAVPVTLARAVGESVARVLSVHDAARRFRHAEPGPTAVCW